MYMYGNLKSGSEAQGAGVFTTLYRKSIHHALLRHIMRQTRMCNVELVQNIVLCRARAKAVDV